MDVHLSISVPTLPQALACCSGFPSSTKPQLTPSIPLRSRLFLPLLPRSSGWSESQRLGQLRLGLGLQALVVKNGSVRGELAQGVAAWEEQPGRC